MGRIVVPFAIKLLETNVPNVEDKLAKRVSKLIELLLRYDEAIRDAVALAGLQEDDRAFLIKFYRLVTREVLPFVYLFSEYQDIAAIQNGTRGRISNRSGRL